MPEEQRKDEEAEVEAHRKRHMATDEPSDDADSDDDVEAHSFRLEVMRKD
jgi:hypothetical protein